MTEATPPLGVTESDVGSPEEPLPPSSSPSPYDRPLIASAPLSLLMATRDQGALVESVVDNWIGFLDQSGRDYEFILIDDGSGDATPAVTETLAARHPRLRVLRLTRPRGFGFALRTALPHARHPLLFYTECDPGYQPGNLDRLFKCIDKVDVVMAYRKAGGRQLLRSFSQRLFRWLARGLFAVRAKDLDCRFLLARRQVFDRILIQSDGAFAHAEILAKGTFVGWLMGESLISYSPSAESGPFAWGPLLAEAYQVFFHPDFGPPSIPPLPSSGFRDAALQ